MQHINVAIDGPAGAGKSTVARAVAHRLGCMYLETGAMYRAVALYMQRKGVEVRDEEAVEANLEGVHIDMVPKDGALMVLLCGEDVSEAIRANEVSKLASDVSKHPSVRMKLVEMQRRIARENDVVLDGRDIGSFVLPDAKHKIFLTATSRERAARRLKDLERQGVRQSVEEVEREIMQRDHNDMTRDFAPLVLCHDAYVLDTTQMEVDEVIETILEMVKE